MSTPLRLTDWAIFWCRALMQSAKGSHFLSREPHECGILAAMRHFACASLIWQGSTRSIFSEVKLKGLKRTTILSLLDFDTALVLGSSSISATIVHSAADGMADLQNPVHKIAVILFPDADILDYAGPMEILSHASYNRNPDAPQLAFQLITVAGDSSIATPTGHGALSIVTAISTEEALARVREFSALIVPGGPPKVIQSMVGPPTAAAGPEISLIKAFASLQSPAPCDEEQERVLLSICTGALLLGAAGVLDRIPCTTHHMAVGALATMCKAAGKSPSIIKGESGALTRYVDAGIARPHLRIISAGGISSGLDAALRFIDVFFDRRDAEAATRERTHGSPYSLGKTSEFISKVMEYERRQLGE